MNRSLEFSCLMVSSVWWQEDRFALEKVEKDLKVLDLFIQQTTEQSEEDDRAKGYAHHSLIPIKRLHTTAVPCSRDRTPLQYFKRETG